MKKGLMRNRFFKSVVPPDKIIPEKIFKKIQKLIPIITVDLMILRKKANKDKDTETLLIKRKIYPEAGKWCFVGGRVLKNEKLGEAIERQARRELGISVSIVPPWGIRNPLGVFDDPHSDKQKHFISLTYPAKIRAGKLRLSGPEFSEIKWFPLKKLPKIAFNQKRQINAFIKIQRNF